jgi:cell division protein FtsQ
VPNLATMARGRTGRGSRHGARAASVVVPFPRGKPGNRLDLARFVPSGRSLLLAFALVAGVIVAYWGARTSSAFAVRDVDVRGAPPAVEREVQTVAADAVGRSLLALEPEALEAAVRSLPSVAGASVDRAFPHTLVVKVAAERPVAVARRGESAWLVTGAGEIVGEIEKGSQRDYPRLWLKKNVAVRVGGSLPAELIPATRSLAAAGEARLPRKAKGVRLDDAGVTLVLRNGLELRLGGADDLHLKLAVAGRILPLVESGSAYLDVSVPERPVSST